MLLSGVYEIISRYLNFFFVLISTNIFSERKELCYQRGADCSEKINMGYTYTLIGLKMHPKDVCLLRVDWITVAAGELL